MRGKFRDLNYKELLRRGTFWQLIVAALCVEVFGVFAFLTDHQSILNTMTLGNWAKTYVLKSGSDFAKLVPSSAKSVVFTDIAMPESATLIDVDADGDGGVVAWLDGTTMYVSSQKAGQKVIFNESSGWMFAQNRTLTNIVFDNVDTSNTKTMDDMFYDCTGLTDLDLGNFDTSKVTDFAEMFMGIKLNSLNISSFNTSKADVMRSMFRDFTIHSLDLTNFDISQGVNIDFMFADSTIDKLDISSFDNRNSEIINGTFGGLKVKEITLGANWRFFEGGAEDGALDDSYYGDGKWYNKDGQSWSAMDLLFAYNADPNGMAGTYYAGGQPYSITYNLDGGSISGQPTSYNIETATFTLPTPTKEGYTFEGWYEASDFSGSAITQIDAGSTGNKTFYAKWTPINYTITYNLNGGTLSGQKTSYNIETATFTLSTPTKSGYEFLGWTGSNGSTPQTNVTISSGSIGNMTYTANWELLKTYKLKTGKEFKALIPTDTTSIVFTDAEMPADATLIDVDADGDGGVVAWLNGTTFKVSTQKTGQKIIANEDSSYMFDGRNLGSTTTQKVTGISGLGNLDTSQVTNMSYMFYYAGSSVSKFYISGLDSWNTSSVTNMSSMFGYAGYVAKTSSFYLNLSGWNTSSVTNMTNMFFQSAYLKTIYVGDGWDVSGVTSSSSMFSGCSKIVGQSGTTYNSSKTDKSMANWETGYLTYKANNGS